LNETQAIKRFEAESKRINFQLMIYKANQKKFTPNLIKPNKFSNKAIYLHGPSNLTPEFISQIFVRTVGPTEPKNRV